MEDAELLTKWQRKNKEYKQRHQLTAHRENDTMARLKKFQNILQQKQTAAAEATAKAASQGTAEPSTAGNEVCFAWGSDPVILMTLSASNFSAFYQRVAGRQMSPADDQNSNITLTRRQVVRTEREKRDLAI